MSSTSSKPIPWHGISLALFAVVVLAVLGYYGRFWALRARAERRLQGVIEQLERDDPDWHFEDLKAARETIEPPPWRP